MHIIDILEHVLLCTNLLFDGNFAKNSHREEYSWEKLEGETCN